MTDEESKLTRREFVKFSAMTSLTAGGLYVLTVKSDSLAQELPEGPSFAMGEGDTSSYTYNNGTIP